MKSFTILLVLVFLALINLNAQNTTTGFESKQEDVTQKQLEKGKNYDVNIDVENHDAYFPMGEDSLFRYIYTKLRIPEEVAKAEVAGTSVISFKVNFDGNVMRPSVIQAVGHGIDEQICQILSGLKFAPATSSGVAFRSDVLIEVPIKAVYIYNINNR